MPDPTLAALELQVSCYQRLAKLAEIQHEHVQQSRTEELLSVLGQRQFVLDQLAAQEQTILPAKRRWSEYLGGLEPADRGRAEGLMAETRRLLEQITTADRNDSLILQQRKLSVGRELGHSVAAKKVNRVYAAAAYGKKPAGVDVRR